MNYNFYSPSTGKQYQFSYKSKIVDGVVKYYHIGSGWKELTDDSGEPVCKIEPKTIHPTAIRTETASKF
jgi:hypothetical protein